MTLQQFYDALNRHDWFYMYSDDGYVSRRGAENMKRLSQIAQESAELNSLFLAFVDHQHHNKPKPTRPE